jgi:hypothetical protein
MSMPSTDASRQIVVPELPKTLDDFIALRDDLAVTPEGGAAMMVLALAVYAADPKARFGQDALVIAADHSRLTPKSDGYKGWNLTVRDQQHIERQMASKPWGPRSYFAGTSPGNGYRLPEPPYRFELSRNLYSGDEAEGRVKLFVATSGASRPRPVSVQRNNRGLWKALEWSSLTVGVEPPAMETDDDL